MIPFVLIERSLAMGLASSEIVGTGDVWLRKMSIRPKSRRLRQR